MKLFSYDRTQIVSVVIAYTQQIDLVGCKWMGCAGGEGLSTDRLNALGAVKQY